MDATLNGTTRLRKPSHKQQPQRWNFLSFRT